jgi:hypothetical protein
MCLLNSGTRDRRLMTEQQNSQGGSQNHVNELVGLADAERRTRVVIVPPPPGRTRERRVRLALACTTPILSAILLVGFVAPVREFLFEKRLTPEVARQEARQTLDALVAGIESFRRDYNELPESLFEIGVPPRGQWTYDVSGKAAYRVRGSLQGQHVAFDSPPAGAR